MVFYCPHCGLQVNIDEKFCVSCGKQLPKDIENRLKTRRKRNYRWLLPFFMALVVILTILSYTWYLQREHNLAKEFYELGEKAVLNQQYKDAENYFETALLHKPNFPEAEVAQGFTKLMLEIEKNFVQAKDDLVDEKFNESLSLMNESENLIKNYHGQAVNEIIDEIVSLRNEITLAHIEKHLQNNPSIVTLKSLLWEAQSLNTNKAEEIASYIQQEIVDFTFVKASEKLQNKQFNDAKFIVEDGLKYAPDSEKLNTLRSAIDKEKTAFEIAEQRRIEQAIHMAEEDRAHNESSAIQLKDVKIKLDDQDRLIVKGKVKSVATIPVHSILVEYSIIEDEEIVLENEVFVYPEVLYTDETGKFEYTHYEIDENLADLEIHINKMKWYTD